MGKLGDKRKIVMKKKGVVHNLMNKILVEWCCWRNIKDIVIYIDKKDKEKDIEKDKERER